MATAQVNGSATTISEYGYVVEASNNHGTIRANGTSASNVVENVKTVRPVVDAFGSKVVEDTVTEKDYAGKAVAAGTFAHNHTKPISSLITDELAGVSTNAIKTPGNDSDVIRSINKVENQKSVLFTKAIRENKYNRYTGAFDAGYPAAQTITPWNITTNATGNSASDDSANPTQSVPGELTYMRGSKTPYNDNYKAKTNY